MNTAILVPVWAKKYIEVIRGWFKFNYGIDLSNPQIIAFCTHSINYYSDSIIDHIVKHKGVKQPTFNISINPETKEIISNFLEKYKKSMGLNIPMLIGSLLIYRAQTLPVVRQEKPLKYRISGKNISRFDISKCGIDI